jgi:ethanolamine utilization protein EutN
MQLGKVVGHAVATVKHSSFQGWRFSLAQPLTVDGNEDGEPLLVIDPVGAGCGSVVMLSNDGAGARQLVGAKNSPARWFVMGIVD